MKKNIVQDVVFSKRSIRDVTLPSRQKKPIPPEPQTPDEAPLHRPEVFIKKPPYSFDYNQNVVHKESHKGLWVSLFVFVIALCFGISGLFVSAEVTITPKTQTIPINIRATAQKNPPSTGFGYQVVSVSSTGDQTAPAGESKKIETKATGTILIYNNTGSAPQTLIEKTRFQSPDGKIYRITKTVVIPGNTTKAGKTIPGSAEAVVTAEEVGSSYNKELIDFTLPGLKGTPRYTTIYARSKTPITGGFSGIKKVVDQKTQTSIEETLKTSLKAKMQSDIVSQIPANFIFYEKSLSYSFEPLVQTAGPTESEVTLSLKGTAHAIIFDKNQLSQIIIEQSGDTIAEQAGSISVTNINTLNFEITTNTVITQESTNSIGFTLSGDATFQWSFDESILKNELVGIKKSDVLNLLHSKYPSIENAEISIRPFWKQSFPQDPAKITLIKKAQPNTQ
jgi:hypothetical protein